MSKTEIEKLIEEINYLSASLDDKLLQLHELDEQAFEEVCKRMEEK